MDLVSITDIGNRLRGALVHHFSYPIEGAVYESDVDALAYDLVKRETAYGILSHRWLSEGEVSFQDILQMTKTPVTGGMHELKMKVERGGGLERWDHSKETNASLIKIIKFCEAAFRHGCKYVWFDTGCINKQSSAELEESIRSMFSWYRNSALCIAYLSETTNGFEMQEDPWFTRGWTLQELLAPPKVKFYDKNWRPVTSAPNDKVPDTELGIPLWKTISLITGIYDPEDLFSFKPGIHNVGCRMFWASKRQTTRIEDMAYCLLGIFDVSIPIAYGEGELAFFRLQLEIVQRSDDKTLFAWHSWPSPRNSMFAARPACFDTIDFVGPPEIPLEKKRYGVDTSYALTNSGLRIRLPVYDAAVWDVKKGELSNDYEFYVEGFDHTITAGFAEKPTFTHLKVALLSDAPPSGVLAPFAVLLDFDEVTGRHKRIAVKYRVLTVWQLPKDVKHETVFIL